MIKLEKKKNQLDEWEQKQVTSFKCVIHFLAKKKKVTFYFLILKVMPKNSHSIFNTKRLIFTLF